MKRRPRRLAALLMAVFMAFACAGCTVSSVEELYSLPELSEKYVQLQELISQRINEGGEYAAPTGGSYRQSIQLQDLDGDGTAEALAFLADSSHTPAICIYRQDDKGDYYLYVIIAGEGSAVASVEYADLTGNGSAELIIAWQISGDIRLLSVYSLGSQEQLLSVDCSEFLVCDLTGDGVADLLDLRTDYSAESRVEIYSFSGEGTATSSDAALSGGITDVRRLRSGSLSDGTAALFVESDRDDGLVTDVFTAPAGTLRNITLTAAGHSDTLRRGDVFAADINGDRAMEIPARSGDLLQWYSLDAAGNKTLVMTTFHNYDDGWYLELNGLLSQGVTAERSYTAVGERAVTFTVTGAGAEPPRAVLVIYTLTGENRLDRGSADGRFILRQEEGTVYAAQILTDELTGEDIGRDFTLIYAEWQSGDL